jgi:hypothetical protein
VEPCSTLDVLGGLVLAARLVLVACFTFERAPAASATTGRCRGGRGREQRQ